MVKDWFQSRSPSACAIHCSSLWSNPQLPPRASGSNSFFFLCTFKKPPLQDVWMNGEEENGNIWGEPLGSERFPLPPEASVSKQGQRGGHIFSLSLFPPTISFTTFRQRKDSKQRRLLESPTRVKREGAKKVERLCPVILSGQTSARQVHIRGQLQSMETYLFSYLLLWLFVFIFKRLPLLS